MDKLPELFETKRELLWYIKGLTEAQVSMKETLKIDIQRYVGALKHMDFDKGGNVIYETSVQPSRK